MNKIKNHRILRNSLNYNCNKCNMDKDKLDCGNGNRKYNCPKKINHIHKRNKKCIGVVNINCGIIIKLKYVHCVKLMIIL